MSKINKILVIGSGPIVIGQAAELDYAGTQACKALREEGVTSVLVNSNQATTMTDEGTTEIFIDTIRAMVEVLLSDEQTSSIKPLKEYLMVGINMESPERTKKVNS
jgi:carbamoyl-phosphate synthase large subunit